MRSIGLAAMLVLGVTPAMAQDAPCAPPAELSGWTTRHPVTAAIRLGGNAPPELRLGDAVDLALAPIGQLSLAAPLGKPPSADDRGGMAVFRIALSGTYRIAIGGHAWIDVVKGTHPLMSADHTPGPQCAGIAKKVDFRLEPGSYILQLSAAESDMLPVMIVQVP
jgi:hypothetical protein